MDIKEVRAKFPMYNDLSDDQLLKGVHGKYYSDIPYDQFASKVGGMQPAQTQQTKPLSNMDRVVKGVTDPIEGAAQLLYNVLPKQVQDAGDSVNNWIADKTGLVAKIPEKNLSSVVTGQKTGLNALVDKTEKDYQSARTAQGESGIDWYRAAGNVISPANLLVASRASKLAPVVGKFAGNLTGKVASGAAGGVAQGAISPAVNGGDYWDEKATQVGVGAGIGGALPMLGKLLPKNTEAAKKLKEQGIDVPIGQAMGGIAKTIEDKATSIPLIGDAINMARQKSLEQFNIATLNKAMSSIGEKIPKGISAGREAIDYAGRKVSDAYNSILPKLKVQADDQFSSEMTQLKQMATNLPDAEMNQFNRIIKNEVEDRFTSAGLMSGETMKQVESKLGQLARGYGRSEGYEKQQLADALLQAQANLRSMVARNNPEHSQQLKQINSAFASLIRPERAASYVGAENGVFTPSQLLSAVKGTDQSLRHKAFARGDALMQDWAESAKGTLSSKVPNSGTADRMMLGGGALGGLAYLNPAAALGGALATTAYLPGGRKVASGLLNLSEGAANTVSNRSPYATPLISPLMYSLLNGSTNQ